MNAEPSTHRRSHLGNLSQFASLVLIAAPAVGLGLTALVYESTLAAVGAFAELLAALLFLPYRRVWQPPVSGLLILLYLMALGWLWFVTRNEPEGFGRSARGLCLLIAVGLFVQHDLQRTGLAPRRRARELCRRLTARHDYPDQAKDYTDLPEILALQDVLQHDPGPAILLLSHPRPSIVVAALTALQQRSYWRTNEAELILDRIDTAQDDQVRIAGLLCLGNVADGGVVAATADFLKDRVPEVRKAAAQTIPLHDDHRWPLIRDAVRESLAAQSNEPLFRSAAGRWCEAAVCDLTTWAAEPEPLGDRAGKAIVAHYGTLLNTGSHPTLAAEIGRQITDAQTPPAVRVDLAHLLRGLNFITPDLLDRMTDIDQPGPLRILAAEMLLVWNPQNPDAVDVLRGLGRQSNRETALAIARLVQQYLGQDMGLPKGQVQPNTKQAAETAKRVFQWATGRTVPIPETFTAAAAGSAWLAHPTTVAGS